jgi:hypothetical protein
VHTIANYDKVIVMQRGQVCSAFLEPPTTARQNVEYLIN